MLGAQRIELLENVLALLEHLLGELHLLATILLLEALRDDLYIAANLLLLLLGQKDGRTRPPFEAHKRVDALAEQFAALKRVYSIARLCAAVCKRRRNKIAASLIPFALKLLQ